MPSLQRRQILSYLAVASAGGLVGFMAGRAEARKPHVEIGPSGPYGDPRVSIALERPDGRAYEDFWQSGSRYVAGEMGQRYNLRLFNHASHRVEAVVTVDGRDVVSGELGNFADQRGYVIPPHSSVLIDGFRQSLTHAAAFRFSPQQEGYSARKGTPQHSGVIGVAVFDEKARPAPRVHRPVAPPPQPEPYPQPYRDEPYGGYLGRGSDAPSSRNENDEGQERGRDRSRRAPTRKSRRSQPTDTAAAQSQSQNLGTAGPGPSGASRYGGRPHSPTPPREAEHLATQYGESRYSKVREVSFVRRSQRNPDAVLTLYYDSYEALRARGITPERPQPYAPRPYAAQPIAPPTPPRRFAQPPPPRRY